MIEYNNKSMHTLTQAITQNGLSHEELSRVVYAAAVQRISDERLWAAILNYKR